MLPRPLALVLTLTAALSGGCGTMINVKNPTVAPPHKPDAQVCTIYGGVIGDCKAFMEFPWKKKEYLDYVMIPILATITISLDVVADTITLPYTTYETIRRMYRKPDNGSASGTVTVQGAVPAGTAPAPLPAPTPVPSAPAPLPLPTPVPGVPGVSIPPVPPTGPVPPPPPPARIGSVTSPR
jgi:hypothetical protein